MSSPAAVELSRGAVAAIRRMEQGLRPVLHVIDVRPAGDERYLVVLSDGARSEEGIDGHLMPSMSHLVRAGAIAAGTIIRVLDYLCINTINNRRIIIVGQLEILQIECALMGTPSSLTPIANTANSGLTNLFYLICGLTPIAALSPYKQGKWTIKARVTVKSHLQHWYNARGEGKIFFFTGEGEVFDFDLVDAEGGKILATCFSLAVDRFHDLIEVGKVYLISGGIVIPAHKNNPLNSPYELVLGASASVQICSSDA